MSDDERDTLLEFPCVFPIKMMGRDRESFRRAALEIVERHAGSIPDESITTSASSKGNFVALTVTINAESQAQLDNIYRALSAHEEILVAL